MARTKIKERALGVGGEIAKAAAVGLAGQGLAAVVLLLVGGFAALLLTGAAVPAWVLLVMVVILLAIAALLLGQQYRLATEAAEDAAELKLESSRGEQYSGMVQDALDELQRVISGDVDAEVDRYVEQAVLEPALRILSEKPTERVRLSVLLPATDDRERWSMRWAAGHSLAGREKYDQKISQTMARHAFERGDPQYWGDVEGQADFRQNPAASAPTRSLASIPILEGEEVVGVFNAVSSERDAFDDAEQKFLLSLAGILAVAIGFWRRGGWDRPDRGLTAHPSSLDRGNG